MKRIKFAFTMAEILLSLTIIGVVAAITLPSLTGNINERTWNTQRKALYARFSQAMALMPSLNGFGTITEDEEGNIAQDTTTETFITNGLSKVLKINNICDAEHIKDCGIPDKIIANNGNIAFSSFPQVPKEYWAWLKENGKVAAFETANGESIAVFYNKDCKSKDFLEAGLNASNYISIDFICANFIYDLNGNKGPNTMGKDIGYMTALYPIDPVIVAPMPAGTHSSGTMTHYEALKVCSENNSDTRLPNIEELFSIYYNRALTPDLNYYEFWSSTTNSQSQAYILSLKQGHGWAKSREEVDQVICTRR